MHHVLRDGVPLRYDDRGAGPAVVLIHSGLGGSGRVFGAVADQLSTTCRVLTVDMRAHGDSGKTQDGHTVPQYAADLLELLTAVDALPVLPIGWSSGAAVAWQLGMDHPDTTYAIGVIDQSPATVRDDGWPYTIGGTMTPATYPVYLDAVASGSRRATAAAFDPLFVGESPPGFRDYVEVWKTPATVVRQIAEDVGTRDYRPFVEMTDLPQLGLYGVGGSSLWGDDAGLADWMERAGVEVHRFTASNHLPFVEEETEFVEVVRAFVDRHAP